MYNKATLVRRLARDPELREFSNGGSACKLRLITSSYWRDRETGEMKERPEGHNISVYVEKMARRIADACRKGDVILVEGAIETRRWTTPDGETRYMTEIAVRPFQGTIRRMPATKAASPTPALAPDSQEVDEGETETTASTGIPDIEGDIFDDFTADGMVSLDGDGDFPF